MLCGSSRSFQPGFQHLVAWIAWQQVDMGRRGRRSCVCPSRPQHRWGSALEIWKTKWGLALEVCMIGNNLGEDQFMEFDVTGAHPGEDSALEWSGMSMSMSDLFMGYCTALCCRMEVAYSGAVSFMATSLLIISSCYWSWHIGWSQEEAPGNMVWFALRTQWQQTQTQAARQPGSTYSTQEAIWSAQLAGGIADAGFILAQHNSNKVCHWNIKNFKFS